MIKCKCKDCEKRYLGCHDKCKDYQDFRLAVAREKLTIKQSIVNQTDIRARKYERKVFNKRFRKD